LHPLFIIVTFKLIVHYIIIYSVYLSRGSIISLYEIPSTKLVTVLCKYMHRVGWGLVLRFFSSNKYLSFGKI